MPKPNVRVWNMRKRAGGFPAKAERPKDPFWVWFWAQVDAGRTFDSMEQARAEFTEQEDR